MKRFLEWCNEEMTEKQSNIWFMFFCLAVPVGALIGISLVGFIY